MKDLPYGKAIICDGEAIICERCKQADAEQTFRGLAVCPNCAEAIHQNELQDEFERADSRRSIEDGWG